MVCAIEIVYIFSLKHWYVFFYLFFFASNYYTMSYIYFINSKLLYIHFLSLIWGCYAVLTKTICPLTYLENWFLKKAGLDIYSGGFIQQYIFSIVYPTPLSDGARLFLIIFIICTNIVFYLIIIKRFRKKLN